MDTVTGNVEALDYAAAGLGHVYPEVPCAKLKALLKGARLASQSQAVAALRLKAPCS